MSKITKVGITVVLSMVLIVLLVLVICSLIFANSKSKPFKNMQINEIDKIMVVSYELKTTKLLSTDETDEIDDVVDYLKRVSIKKDTKIVMDDKQLNIIGSIIVYFYDSSMKEIYFQKDIIGIDDNWYAGSVNSSISFHELYDSLNGEEQPWKRST